MPAEAWQNFSAGAASKGERFEDWADLDLADLDVGDISGVWARGPLIRRNIADGNFAF